MLLFGILGLLIVGSIVAIILGEKRYENDELEICGWIMGGIYTYSPDYMYLCPTLEKRCTI